VNKETYNINERVVIIMTVIDTKILMEAAEAKAAFEVTDYKTVHVCALKIAELAKLADEAKCTPTNVPDNVKLADEAKCTPTNVSTKCEETTSEEFKIKIYGHGSVTRNGHDKNRGNYSDTRSIDGDVTIEAQEPKGLVKALAEIWSNAIFGDNRKA